MYGIRQFNRPRQQGGWIPVALILGGLLTIGTIEGNRRERLEKQEQQNTHIVAMERWIEVETIATTVAEKGMARDMAKMHRDALKR